MADAKREPKPATWWSFWRWKFWGAPPPTLKRSPIPSLANLMKVDPKSWEIMGQWADRLAVLAVLANLVTVAVYAFVVATQSELPITRGWDAVLPLPWGQDLLVGAIARFSIVTILAVVVTCGAIVLQLGTDFAIPFAAGLASEKYRVVPSLAFAILWPVCLGTTVAMKVDVYSGWGRERIAAATEAKTISEADQRILSQYHNAVPPPIAESEGRIANADAAISNADEAIKGLDTARSEQAALRAKEETGDGSVAGRGPKWREYNEAVVKTDTAIADQRRIKAEATTSRANAIAAKANRVEYDGAVARTTSTIRTVTEGQRALLYDADFVVWSRAGGLAFASVLFVLMSFMIRSAKAEAAKRSNAAFKGVQTRQDNANTRDADYGEAAPLDAKALPNHGDVVTEVVAEVDTPRRQKGKNPHPDKTGDDKVNGVNGYEGNNGTEESGKPPAE